MSDITVFSPGLTTSFFQLPQSATYCLNLTIAQIPKLFPATALTCCIVLMVVDELWDGVKVVLLRQVVLALQRGADVIMFAAS